MTNLMLDYDNWEYYEAQDPTLEDLAEILHLGFNCITTKSINLRGPDGKPIIDGETGKQAKVTTKLFRRKAAVVEEPELGEI